MGMNNKPTTTDQYRDFMARLGLPESTIAAYQKSMAETSKRCPVCDAGAGRQCIGTPAGVRHEERTK